MSLRRRRRRWASLAALAFGLAACQATTPPPSVTASGTLEAIPPPQVLLDLSGKGPITTPNFIPSQEWDLQWRYECAGSPGESKFSLTLYEADGDVVGILVSATGKSGAAVTHQRQIDNYYLGIDSLCPWHVQVRG